MQMDPPKPPSCRHKTKKSDPLHTTPGSQPFWGDVVRWTDVSVPYEKAAVRVRLFESDRGNDILIGRVMLKLTDIEDQAKYKLKSEAQSTKAKFFGAPGRSQSESILNGAEEWAQVSKPCSPG